MPVNTTQPARIVVQLRLDVPATTPAAQQVREEHAGVPLPLALCEEVAALLDSLGLDARVTLEVR
jgi:hypothetical protein